MMRLQQDSAADGTRLNVQGWSDYPPRLSVIADISVRQPSAKTGIMKRSKRSGQARAFRSPCTSPSGQQPLQVGVARAGQRPRKGPVHSGSIPAARVVPNEALLRLI